MQAEAVDAREAPQLGRHRRQAVAVRVQPVQAGQQADLRRQRGQLAVRDVPAATGTLNAEPGGNAWVTGVVEGSK